jgi:hypothetical protein
MKKIHFLYLFSVLLLIGLIASKYHCGYGFTALAGIADAPSDRFIDELKEIPLYKRIGSGGYDGQFYLQIAIDPTLKNTQLAETLDNPEYRSRRILLPALAHCLGAGTPAYIVAIYCMLNVFCWFATAVLLLHWLPPTSLKSFAKWFACMFSMGALESVRYSLTDLPSMMFILGALYFIERNRQSLSAAFLSAAVLTKETSLLALGHYLNPQTAIEPKAIAHFVLRGLLILLPLGIWAIYVSSVFENNQGFSAVLAMPVVSMITEGFNAINAIVGGNWDSRYTFRLIAILGLSYQFYYLLKNRQPENRVWRIGCIFGCLFLFLGTKVWWGYWAACRAVLPMTFAFNILYDNERHYWPIFIAVNFTLLDGIMRYY